MNIKFCENLHWDDHKKYLFNFTQIYIIFQLQCMRIDFLFFLIVESAYAYEYSTIYELKYIIFQFLRFLRNTKFKRYQIFDGLKRATHFDVGT